MKSNRSLGVFAAGCGLALALTAAAQDVPCEKYTLDNGMTVILHVDHSLPIATVNTWYRVGSQDEPPGRSGFAHLFEHLMFMGTARVPGNQFDVLMETGGGANNASTDLHRTNYFSWGPAELLPTLLWLDADRLEDMGLQMTQDKLDKQRDVVRNELRQVVENAPYAKAGEAVYRLLYTPDHPYYYGVIGTHQDLEAATVSNVKDFFASFYVPGNASLVVAGDFEPGEIRPLIAGLFGTLDGGQPLTRKYERPSEPIPARLDGVKRLTAIDRVEQPKVQFSYHSPVAFGPGDAEMQLAARVLADGKSSRLYERLVVREQLAAGVGAWQWGYPLGGMFQVEVLALPNADLERIEALMDEEISRLVREGPTGPELERHKAAVELASLSALESLAFRADRMNEYEYYWGEPNSFKRDLDRFRGATAPGVAEWAGRTLTPEARVIVRVLPEEPERAASARDERPSGSSPGSFSLPEPESFTLGNGLGVMVWNRPGLPLVSMRLVSRAGAASDPDGEKGLASLAVEMMGEGAGELEALAFEDAVRRLGGEFGAGADHESATVSMTVLKRNLGQAAGLFADAVLRPRFDEDAWERVHRLRLEDLEQRAESPGFAAGTVGERLVFGDQNPYAWPADGLPETVEGITLDEARAAQRRLVGPGNSTLLIAGDVSAPEARELAERAFGEWSGSAAPMPRAPGGTAASPTGGALRVVLVNRPGATQTYIRFTAPGMAYDDPARVRAGLLNVILGGSFTSRLNQNLREDKGYTYGARSRFRMLSGAGSFSAAASVQAEVTGDALREFMKEFDRIRAGDITQEETTKASLTMRNDAISEFEGLAGLLGAAEDRLVHGLPFASLGADLAAMGAVSASELNDLAGRGLPIERGVLVLVGDREVVLPQLEGLGLGEVEELDAWGEPAGG